MSFCVTIDRGNTSVKITVFSDDSIVFMQRYDTLTPETLSGIKRLYPTEKLIYSSVVADDAELVAAVCSCFAKVYRLGSLLPMPLVIEYSTPETLGADRIASAVGAVCVYPERNVLVVDSGTAITMDVVSADGHFLGGNIAPGISLRAKSLNSFCGRLPLVDADGDAPLIGHDTQTAIRAGVVRGLVAEVVTLASELQNRFGSVSIILTGGDAELIAKYLPPSLDFLIENNLVAIGLNRILKYNENF